MEEEEEEAEGDARGKRGRVAIGADSRVLRPRGGRLPLRGATGVSAASEGSERARGRWGEKEREKERKSERGERRKSAPNMQQEKKNWRSIGSSW